MMTIYLKRGKDESLRRFHPWIFSGAIHHIEGPQEEGALARVLTAEGAYIATGHWQIGSIAVRVLTFDDEPIDAAFWQRRLQAALEVRRAIGVADNPQNSTYRLVHGEGDHLPGLVIDVYGQTAVVQAHSVGMHISRQQVAEALKAGLMWESANGRVAVDMSGQGVFDAHSRFFGVIYNGTSNYYFNWWIFNAKKTSNRSYALGLYKTREGKKMFIFRSKYTDKKQD